MQCTHATILHLNQQHYCALMPSLSNSLNRSTTFALIYSLNPNIPSRVIILYVPLSCHLPLPSVNLPSPSTSTLPIMSSGHAMRP